MFSRIFDAEIVSLAAAEIRSEAAGRGDMCGCWTESGSELIEHQDASRDWMDKPFSCWWRCNGRICVQVHFREYRPETRKEVAADFRLQYSRGLQNAAATSAEWGKLLLTSGCNILEDSKTLLPQVQNEEITFVIQRMHFCEVVKSFQRTIEAEKTTMLTAVDLNAVKTVVSLANVHLENFCLACRCWVAWRSCLAGVFGMSNADLRTFVQSEFGRCNIARDVADVDLWMWLQQEFVRCDIAK